MIGWTQVALLAAAAPHGAEAAEHGAGGNPLLQVNPGLWIWTLLIFFGVLLVLWRWGWGMMIAKLDQRDEAIRGAIDQAQAERREAETYLEQQRALLADARKQASELIAAAQQEASREKQRIVDDARQEYERIVARGRQQIEQETRAALSEVRETIADLSVEVAGRVLGRVIDDPTHRALARQFVSELDA